VATTQTAPSPLIVPTAADLLGLFPAGTTLDTDGMLVVGGCRLDDVAAQFGTAAYVVAEQGLRARVQDMRDAFASELPTSRVAFASKAFPAVAAYRLMADEGVAVDVAGGGELVMALAGGVPAADLVMHGNAKTDAELQMAVQAGVGLIVLDNSDDVDRLEQLCAAAGKPQPVLVRLVPGIRAETHASMATGHEGQKFGLPLEQARELVSRLRTSRWLQVIGVHVHVGSQILDTAPLAAAVQAAAQLGEFEVYDLGGGLGARYTYAEHAPSPAEYAAAMAAAVRAHLPAGARILVEPGRSLVAQSGITLYRVTTLKRASGKTFVAVDGGMGDNLDVALVGQRFEATVANRVGGGTGCELVGRHCEAGDVLVAGVALDDPQVGDLVAMPVTGAYCFTMANNYNGALRPPVVFCSAGTARAVVRRETYEDLLARHVG
jgi:diaminopimelate decarboxylase